jgi:threonine/homoserine/homoserine lactone efflux protein
MLIAVAVLTIMSIAALIAAITVGSGVIAYACVAGLLLLLIDVLRSQQDPDPAERRRTAGDDLYGEKEVSRDLIREDSVTSQDMLRFILPSGEGHRF